MSTPIISLISTNDELKFLEGNYHIFPDGNEHIPADHLYANDLDIFGANSIFNISTEPLQKWEAGSWQRIYKLLLPQKLFYKDKLR